MKKPKQLERYFKGAANHRRIEILFLLDDAGDISLEKIAGLLNCNFKTLSDHTKRLVHAGLLNKRYQGRQVIHQLSPYGEKFVKFLKSF
jgi:DNA-binding MarR family transcriptional regulator